MKLLHLICNLDNVRDRPAPMIRAVDPNQKVFEGGNAILRCILQRSNEVSYTYIVATILIINNNSFNSHTR